MTEGPDMHTPSAALPGTPAASQDASDSQREDAASMPLLGHLEELRKCLMRCLIALLLACMACMYFAPWLLDQAMLPLSRVMPENTTFVYTQMPGGFLAHFKVALVAGLFVASPYLFYQLWRFIAPGLYSEERQHTMIAAISSVVFFLGGAAFCYWLVLPFAFPFFLSYSSEKLVAMPNIEDYLSLVLKLLLAFGFIFEMPLFAYVLARIGLVSGKSLRAVRKYAVVTIFTVAAILTPPDVGSQIMLAVPMLLLYELGIHIADYVVKNKQAA